MSPGRRRAASPAHRLVLGAVLLLAAFTFARPSGAWLLPEHTRIGRRAFEQMGAKGQTDSVKSAHAALEQAWKEVVGKPNPQSKTLSARLCKDFARPSASRLVQPTEECVDFPMLPALAADFACSPGELRETLTSWDDWIQKIIAGGHGTEQALARADNAVQRLDAWHADHVHNFANDPKYLERASGNDSHFVMLRRTSELAEYLQESFKAGQTPNAFAFYALYHVSALRLALQAGEARDGAKDDAKKKEEARHILTESLFAEAFALHFLEDAFSAGHAVGSTGGKRERAGTHDHYCEHGFEAHPWPEQGNESIASLQKSFYLAHGDAFMEEDDVDRAALAVAVSLAHLGEVIGAGREARDERRKAEPILADKAMAFTEHIGSPRMDHCQIKEVPEGLARAAHSTRPSDTGIFGALRRTYMPAYGRLVEDVPPFTATRLEVRPALPRISSAMGPFLGLFASGRYGLGYPFLVPEPLSGKTRFMGTMEAGVELGVTADGITTTTTDAVLFLQVGVVGQSAELDAPVFGRALVPDRTGLTLRVRAPYLVVPGDGLVAAALAPVSRGAKWWVVNAAERGPWYVGRTYVTWAGGFHFVLGREVGLRWLWQNGGESFESFGIDVPVFELKSKGFFAGDFGSAFAWQLGAWADFGNAPEREQRTRAAGAYARFAMSGRWFPKL